jgi:NADPH-dependent ferric siderophore reductase
MFPFSRTQGLMSQLLAPLKPGTRRLRVRAVHTLSPRMRRVVFTGDAHDALADLADAAPGAAIKLMFPAAAASGSASGTARTLGRAYTIRRYHAARGVLEIDFVVHDDTPHAQHGPAARWLERAAPGDVIEFAGPKRGFHADPAAPWTLLVGDETALPAIFAILEALPESAPAQAFIAIGHGHARLPLADTAQARNADIHWIEAEIDHAAGLSGGRGVAAQAGACAARRRLGHPARGDRRQGLLDRRPHARGAQVVAEPAGGDGRLRPRHPLLQRALPIQQRGIERLARRGKDAPRLRRPRTRQQLPLRVVKHHVDARLPATRADGNRAWNDLHIACDLVHTSLRCACRWFSNAHARGARSPPPNAVHQRRHAHAAA